MSRFSGIIPNLGNGHRLFHGIIQGIALLSSEHIEDLDRAIALAYQKISSNWNRVTYQLQYICR